MTIPETRYSIDGGELLLRCPDASDAERMVDYLKTVSGETRFLRCDPDEIHYTQEQEIAFIESYNTSSTSLLLQAFLDGEYVGNCSFCVPGPSRRNGHRADIGIALFQKFTGQGIGAIMMQRLIETAKEAGLEQCELTVVSTNARAISLYQKLGFRECGRIPRANRYADGTYSDDIFMVLHLKGETNGV